MNPFAAIRSLVIDTLAALEAEGAIPPALATGNITVEPPRDAAHGDMATNAAMAMAKAAKMKPRDLAEALAPRLEADPRVVAASVADYLQAFGGGAPSA